MCSRFTSIAPQIEIERRFDVQVAYHQTQPNYNAAPSHRVAAVIQKETRQLHGMRWNLSLPWMEGKTLINVRKESLLEKESFQSLFETQRCIIPANGFYEWQMSGKMKFPHYFRLNTHEPFGFAGLYEIEQSPTGTEVMTCAIITTNSNEVVAPIHNRMPVMLQSQHENQWLDPEQGMETPQNYLSPYPADQMQAYPVSTKVNSPKFNSPACVQPKRQRTLF